MREKITIQAEPNKDKKYNYLYIFKGKRVYKEYKIKRYIRVINFLKIEV